MEVLRAIKSGGHVDPRLIVATEGSDHLVVLVLADLPPTGALRAAALVLMGKDVVEHILPAEQQSNGSGEPRKISDVAFAADAWIAPPDDAVRPSEHPERVEAVIIVSMLRGGETRFALRPYSRSADGIESIDPPFETAEDGAVALARPLEAFWAGVRAAEQPDDEAGQALLALALLTLLREIAEDEEGGDV